MGTREVVTEIRALTQPVVSQGVSGAHKAWSRGRNHPHLPLEDGTSTQATWVSYFLHQLRRLGGDGKK